MKSKIFFITGILLISFSAALYAASEDRIVAIVNDDVITLSDLENSLQPVMKRIERIPEEEKRKEVAAQAKMAVMKQLIDDLLIAQEAAKMRISATDKEVDRVLEDIVKEEGISIEKLKGLLAEKGATLDEYRDEIRKSRIKRKLIERTVKAKVAVSEEEIGKYYAEHRATYEGKEANRIQQILIVKPKIAEDGVTEKLRAQAEMILQKLRGGESFDLLVSTYSQGPAADTGGDLGFVEKGLMFPEVDAVAFSLEKGKISDVIESPVGFHIIRVTDKRGAGIKPIEEVREEIIGVIGNEKMKRRFDEWLKELREKSLVEIRL